MLPVRRYLQTLLWCRIEGGSRRGEADHGIRRRRARSCRGAMRMVPGSCWASDELQEGIGKASGHRGSSGGGFEANSLEGEMLPDFGICTFPTSVGEMWDITRMFPSAASAFPAP